MPRKSLWCSELPERTDLGSGREVSREATDGGSPNAVCDCCLNPLLSETPPGYLDRVT